MTKLKTAAWEATNFSGQNKMRNKTTPPLESMMNSRSVQSAPFFPSLKWGRGGLNFSFILSNIVRNVST